MITSSAMIRLPSSLTDDIAGTFGLCLRELARRPATKRLTLDARDTVEVSVRGLGLIVAVHRIAGSRGCHVRVVNAQHDVEVLLCESGIGDCP